MVFFADSVIEFFDAGASSIEGPYGGEIPGDFPVPVDVSVVLGDDPGSVASFLSLPTGSFVTVGFTNRIIDGPGNDLFIREAAAGRESADVFVSADGINFTFLGVAQDNGETGFDLGSIGFNAPVRAVKIMGLDSRGTSPGFDVVNVQALQVITPSGNRILDGTELGERIVGGNGNDTLSGNGGDDLIIGRGGNDRSQGGDGNDRINGNNGRDVLTGGSGDDRLNGGKGNDRMNGGSDDDIFVVKSGRDKVTTGNGKDRILIGSRASAIIRDFSVNLDRIRLPGSLRRSDFDDLDIVQRGNKTLIRNDGNLVAQLQGVRVSELSEANFI